MRAPTRAINQSLRSQTHNRIRRERCNRIALRLLQEPRRGTRSTRIGFLRRFFWLEDKIAKLAEAGAWADRSTWPELEVVRQGRAGRVEALGDDDAKQVRRRNSRTYRSSPDNSRVDEAPGAELFQRSSNRAGLGHWRTGCRNWEMLSRLNLNEAAALKASFGKEVELSLVGLDANEREHRRQRPATSSGTIDGADRPRRRKNPSAQNAAFWIRVGTAATLVLCLLGTVSAVIDVLTRKSNLALNRPTRASSYLASEITCPITMRSTQRGLWTGINGRRFSHRF